MVTTSRLFSPAAADGYALAQALRPLARHVAKLVGTGMFAGPWDAPRYLRCMAYAELARTLTPKYDPIHPEETGKLTRDQAAIAARVADRLYKEEAEAWTRQAANRA